MGLARTGTNTGRPSPGLEIHLAPQFGEISGKGGERGHAARRIPAVPYPTRLNSVGHVVQSLMRGAKPLPKFCHDVRLARRLA